MGVTKGRPAPRNGSSRTYKRAAFKTNSSVRNISAARWLSDFGDVVTFSCITWPRLAGSVRSVPRSAFSALQKKTVLSYPAGPQPPPPLGRGGAMFR